MEKSDRKELNTLLSGDLKYAIENGIIDLSQIQLTVEMTKRKEMLDKHPYEVWQGKNGKWYTYILGQDGKRIQRERTTRAAIENIIIRFQQTLIENPTIDEVFAECNEYMLHDRKRISPATYMRNRQCYERHYGEFGKKRIRDVTPADFIDFLEMQIPEHRLTAKGFSNLKSVTKSMLKRAKKRGFIYWSLRDVFDDLDVSDVDFRKVVREDYQEVFDDKETAAICGYLVENLDLRNAGLLLAFCSGIRPGELSTLKPEDLGTDGTIQIRRTESKYQDDRGVKKFYVKDFPKTKAGVRTVVLPEQSVWIVKRLLDLSKGSREYLFERSDGSRMDNQSFYRRLELVCKKLGIYRKSPNKIRKTYDSILLDNGADRRLVKDQMGHADIQVSERSYHRNRKSIEKKREILTAIPEFDWFPIKTNQRQVEKT